MKENLTPYVLEIVEQRRRKVVVYGANNDDAMNIAWRLHSNGTIVMDGKPAYWHIMPLRQASEEDMRTYSDIFDRNGKVSLPSESDHLVTVDLEGYVDALGDPSGETECFTLDGRKVE